MKIEEYPEILLVEDDPGDAELTMRALRKHQFSPVVRVMTDGQEALDYLLERCAEREGDPGAAGPLPGLIILDLNLPKVRGMEILRQLKMDDRLRRIPVVIFSSSVEEQDVSESYDLCANSYVLKPVDFDRFANTVAELGFYWLAVNVKPPEAAQEERPEAGREPGLA